MKRERERSNPTGKRRWIERNPKLALGVAIVLVVLPPFVMGVIGSWGLLALELEPEQFHAAATDVAETINGRAREMLFEELPRVVPGEAFPLGRPLQPGEQPSALNLASDEEVWEAQRAYLLGANPLATAALTFTGKREPHVETTNPAVDASVMAIRVAALRQAFRTLRAGEATTGFFSTMSRSGDAGEDRLYFLLSYSSYEWDDELTSWVAWDIDTRRLHAKLDSWAQELRGTDRSLPVDYRILHWSIAEPVAQGLQFALPLDRKCLPFWRLSVTVDTALLPANRVQWRSLFYAIFAVVTVPLAFLAAMFIYARIRKEVRDARNKVDFVANVTHELRTPLTSIRMFAETLMSGRIRSEEDRQEALEIIHNETQRLGRLIDRVLEFNRLERQTKVFHFEAHNLEEVVRGTLRVFLAGDEATHPKINVQIEPDMPPVECDKDTIRELLLNLLTNAEKYAGVELPVDVRVRTDRKYAIIEVIDRGPGIAEDEQPRIFEKFYRANDTLNRKVEGTGLGLAISRAIVKAHRGSLTVTSSPGEGAVFTVRLPLRRDVPAAVSGRFPPTRGRG